METYFVYEKHTGNLHNLQAIWMIVLVWFEFYSHLIIKPFNPIHTNQHPQNLRIWQNKWGYGVTPDPFSHLKKRKKGLVHETISIRVEIWVTTTALFLHCYFWVNGRHRVWITRQIGFLFRNEMFWANPISLPGFHGTPSVLCRNTKLTHLSCLPGSIGNW